MPIYDLAYFDIRICVGLWSVCCRFVIGLSSGLSVCRRLRFQHCVNDRFSIGAMSVIYQFQIGRFHTESFPKWPRLVLRCLRPHCRWPTAGRLIEKVAGFVGFVSVWPVWLGYKMCCLECVDIGVLTTIFFRVTTNLEYSNPNVTCRSFLSFDIFND